MTEDCIAYKSHVLLLEKQNYQSNNYIVVSFSVANRTIWMQNYLCVFMCVCVCVCVCVRVCGCKREEVQSRKCMHGHACFGVFVFSIGIRLFVIQD